MHTWRFEWPKVLFLPSTYRKFEPSGAKTFLANRLVTKLQTSFRYTVWFSHTHPPAPSNWTCNPFIASRVYPLLCCHPNACPIIYLRPAIRPNPFRYEIHFAGTEAKMPICERQTFQESIMDDHANTHSEEESDTWRSG